jgi:hypothetical protein
VLYSFSPSSLSGVSTIVTEDLQRTRYRGPVGQAGLSETPRCGHENAQVSVNKPAQRRDRRMVEGRLEADPAWRILRHDSLFACIYAALLRQQLESM